jgi:hypothetical protein
MSQDEADQGVRHLVLVHGRDEARSRVSKDRRPLVDIAAEVMADEARAIGFSYTGFCLTALPHKRLADEMVWEKQGRNVKLVIEPGRRKATPDGFTHIGVPCGARARRCSGGLGSQGKRRPIMAAQIGPFL